MTTKKFTLAEAEALLRDKFAPWVKDLDIRFDSVGAGTAVLRVPFSTHLNREGGSICGQAIMALADTAMVFAVSSACEAYVPMTTVSQTSTFLRPVTEDDLIAHARIIKAGRTLMYGEVTLYTSSIEKPVAHITSSYMLL